MVAKSKTQIITDINNKIIANGNIKALDTNVILKDILDCTELNSSATISTFSYKSATPLNDKKGGRLSYSLRGVVDSFVNITFKIEILESGVNNLTFTHNNVKIFDSLKSIIENPDIATNIDFLVKIENVSNPSTNRRFRVGSLNFNYNQTSFNIKIDSQEINDNLLNGDQIFTSFAVHCPNAF
jgi:hypothetical protein